MSAWMEALNVFGRVLLVGVVVGGFTIVVAVGREVVQTLLHKRDF